jgi:fatty acid amide hydrolase
MSDVTYAAAGTMVAAGAAWAYSAVKQRLESRRRLAELRERVAVKLASRAAQRVEFKAWAAANGELVPSAEERARLVRLSACELVAELRSGKTSSVSAVVTACLRAIECGEKFDSNADEMFMSAITRAKEADLKRERGETLGALHGLPITVKDNVDVSGADTTVGMMVRAGVPATADAAVVETLVRAGAIPFCKSNVPQLLMLPESMNRVWGRAKNPWQPARTPGGSSGGEAVLVATGASWCGIGTDIGGSIRIPAHYCGIVGFKPTPERMSSVGSRGSSKVGSSGQQAIRGVAGPMARCVADAEMLQRLWFAEGSAMHARDPYAPPLAWREPTPNSPERSKARRVGLVLEDGWFEVAPANRRATREAAAALEAAGYVVVPFSIPEPKEFVRLYAAIMSADGALRNLAGGLDAEPVVDEYKELLWIASLGSSSRALIARLLRAAGEDRKAFFLGSGGQTEVIDYYKLVVELGKYRQLFAAAFKAEGLDCLLLPGGTLPALPHGHSAKLAVVQSLNFMWNALHWPCGTVPVTVTREDECVWPGKQDSLDVLAQGALTGAQGMPVGVQVATLPWQDELCLDIMKDVEKGVCFDANHQRPFL